MVQAVAVAARRRAARGKSLLLIDAGLVLLTLVVFGQALGFGFILLDDPGYVTDNIHVLGGPTAANIAWAFTTTDEANWHPLTWISLMIDAALGGGTPFAFHLTSLLLHMATTVLLFHWLAGVTRAPAR